MIALFLTRKTRTKKLCGDKQNDTHGSAGILMTRAQCAARFAGKTEDGVSRDSFSSRFWRSADFVRLWILPQIQAYCQH